VEDRDDPVLQDNVENSMCEDYDDKENDNSDY
jgi:hypothetical protein